MTRRRRTITRRPISAAEVAALAGIELDPRPLEFEADDRRGTWTVREHSQLKRQWRFVRRLLVIVQVIIALFALWWFVFCRGRVARVSQSGHRVILHWISSSLSTKSSSSVRVGHLPCFSLNRAWPLSSVSKIFATMSASPITICARVKFGGRRSCTASRNSSNHAGLVCSVISRPMHRLAR